MTPSPRLAATARRRGGSGERWLAGLPALVAQLSREWQLQPEQSLPGGSEALVLAVRTATGEPAVLKLAVPGPGAAAEVRHLVEGRAEGLVEVLRVDPGRHAVLMERLGPTLASSALPLGEQLTVLAAALARCWTAPVDPVERGRAGAKAVELAQLCRDLQQELGGPCPDEVLGRALAALERVAAVPAERVALLHGDPHPGNLLRRPRGGWVFIDPDGFVGDIAYDLGVTMRSWCHTLSTSTDPAATAAAWAHRLGAAASVDPAAVWDWAFAERVSSGLYLLALGEEQEGRDHIVSAAAVAGGRPT